MSRSLRDAIGLSPQQEVVGKTDYDLFPKIVAETYRQNDRLVLEQGRTLINEIHAGGFVGGVTKWFFFSKYPLRNREEVIIGPFTSNQRYDEAMGSDDDLNRLLPAIEKIASDGPAGGGVETCMAVGTVNRKKLIQLRMSFFRDYFVGGIVGYKSLPKTVFCPNNPERLRPLLPA